MSRKYKTAGEVPSDVLCLRLEELSDAVINGRQSIEREFTMRIPAEIDRDPDLVLSAAAHRIRELESAKREYRKHEFCKAMNCSWLKKDKCTLKPGCSMTARMFHRWLKENGFKIVKDI